MRAKSVELADGLAYEFFENYADAIGAILQDLTGSPATFYVITSTEYHNKFVDGSDEATRAKQKLAEYKDKVDKFWGLYKKTLQEYWDATQGDYLSDETKERDYQTLKEFMELDIADEIDNAILEYTEDPERLYQMIVTGYLIQAAANHPTLINSLLRLFMGGKVKTSDGQFLTHILAQICELIFNGTNLLVMDYIDKKTMLEEIRNRKTAKEQKIMVFDKIIPISHARKKLEWYTEFEKAQIAESVESLCKMIEQTRLPDKQKRAAVLRQAVKNIRSRYRSLSALID